MFKAFVVRIALLGLAIALIWNTVNYTQDRNMWFLSAFLVAQLYDFVTFILEVVNSGCNLEDENKSLKNCLLLFLIAICPAICVMEHHRMQEFYMFYGRWDCVSGTYNLGSTMKSTENGMVKVWSCVRTRPITQCYRFKECERFVDDLTKELTPSVYLVEAAREASHKWMKPNTDENSWNFFRYDQNGNKLKTGCDLDSDRPEVCNMTYLECDQLHFDRNTKRNDENKDREPYYIVNSSTTTIDEGKNVVRFCYNRSLYWDDEWCKKNMNRCNYKDAPAPYISMKLRCRLVDCIPFLCVTIVSWMLVSDDRECQLLTMSFLRNFFCAFEIFQLFESFDEPIAYTPNSWNRILAVWPLCLLHLYFINIMGSDANILPVSESPSISAADPESPPSDSENSPSLAQQESNENNIFTEMVVVNLDMWAVIITGVLYDGLCLFHRLKLLSPIDVFEPHIHFFIIKHIVFILAQLFRAILLCRLPCNNV